MDTEYGIRAIANSALFETTVDFRKSYRPSGNVDYDLISPQTLQFIPQNEARKSWSEDYKKLTDNMISGDFLPYEKLEVRLNILKSRFQNVTTT